MKKNSIQINKSEQVSFVGAILKGSLMALSVCLIFILIFAFVLRFVAIDDSLIRPINQIIKTLSILIGTFFGLKKSSGMGLISGLVIGVMFTIIAFVSFSILDGGFEFGVTLINDCMFGAVIGGISGIIAVNLRKK
ncbi:MAG: TIGR04086 family membrane protein [Clostridia bacterium]|nr:TIGR04086 family membrane protein [Clostridia bacterium]